MTTLSEVVDANVRPRLKTAAEQGHPLRLAFEWDGAWRVCRGRVADVLERHMVCELSDPDELMLLEALDGRTPISLNLHCHRYRCLATVYRDERPALDGSPPEGTVRLTLPESIRRVDRRAYNRIEMDPGEEAKAVFWPGGLRAGPEAGTYAAPQWEGCLTSVGVGGFQALVDSGACEGLRAGDSVGVRLALPGQGGEIRADAQFLYSRIGPDGALAGFQFIGLSATSEGRATIQALLA